MLRTLLLAVGVAALLAVQAGAQTVGQWINITPAAIPQGGNGGNNCDYGSLAFVIDPVTPTTLYLGSCEHGVFKTTNAGGTWAKVNTGINGTILDGTRQWTMAIDPTNPQVLYTNSGYGGGNNNGAWKSINGGVDWARIWPPPNNPELGGIVAYDFVAQVAMDPTDARHVFLSFHGACAAPWTSVCYAESRDAGSTWTLKNGDTRWLPSEAQTIYIVDGNRWLFANHSDGLWRTSNAGATWTLINSQAAGHWPSTLYQAANGVFYIGADNGIYRSVDFVTWTQMSVGYLVNGITGDGSTIFAANAGSLTPWVPPGTNVYMTSAETDGQNWTPAPWPVPAGMWTQGSGGGFGYDRTNHILYSSNGTAGFWKVKTSASDPPPPPPPPPPVCETVVRVDGVTKYVTAAASVCANAHS